MLRPGTAKPTLTLRSKKMTQHEFKAVADALLKLRPDGAGTVSEMTWKLTVLELNLALLKKDRLFDSDEFLRLVGLEEFI